MLADFWDQHLEPIQRELKNNGDKHAGCMEGIICLLFCFHALIFKFFIHRLDFLHKSEGFVIALWQFTHTISNLTFWHAQWDSHRNMIFFWDFLSTSCRLKQCIWSKLRCNWQLPWPIWAFQNICIRIYSIRSILTINFAVSLKKKNLNPYCSFINRKFYMDYFVK